MALESGMTPASTLNDSPLSINTGTEVYTPKNYDGAFHGVVTLRSALANSYNIPAVRLSVKLGPDAIIAKGKEAGLNGWELDGSYGYSVVLGGRETRLLDMVNMYAMFARQGTYYPVTGITSVKDANGFEIYKDIRQPKRLFSEGLHIPCFPNS
jgi:penicillin-binding protein 1C